MLKIIMLLWVVLFFAGCQEASNMETPTINLTATPVPMEEPTNIPMVEESDTVTPTPITILSVSITYTPVEIDGVTRIQCEEGKGIELDLNGDGVKEQVYTAEEGIYINGILQSLRYKWKPVYTPHAPEGYGIWVPWEEYHIVDIDLADNYYNLVFFYQSSDAVEAITYYDGELKEIDSLSTFGGSGRPFSTAEYYGDGTLLIKDVLVDFLGIEYSADLEFRLNENNQLERMETFISRKEPFELELLETITAYSEPAYDSEEVIVQPQTVYGLGTLNDWAKLRLENGTEIWLHFEIISGEGSILDNGKHAEELFSGYPNVN